MLSLVLGGARSGKSRYAQSLAGEGPVCFVATASVGSDPEMARRVERHRADRPAGWRTVEAPIDIANAVERATEPTVVVDCVTLWMSNLFYRHRSLRPEAREKRVERELAAFVDAVRASERDVIVVSNDVGSGVVPDNEIAREFRDLQGLANQELARAADRVVLMVAGLATTLKA